MAVDFLVSTDWLAEHLRDPNVRATRQKSGDS